MELCVLICRPAPDALAGLGEMLAGPEWDVAVLHRVPARWVAETATRTRSEVRVVRGVSGGRGAGADAILCARDRIIGDRSERLRRRLRTRAVVHGARLACGIVVAGVDGDGGERALPAARRWAAGEGLLVVADDRILLTDGVTAGAPERVAAGAVMVRMRTATAKPVQSGTV